MKYLLILKETLLHCTIFFFIKMVSTVRDIHFCSSLDIEYAAMSFEIQNMMMWKFLCNFLCIIMFCIALLLYYF